MRATPSPTRRSLVAQAGLAAIAATSVPLASAAANPDAVLIDMVAALAAAQERRHAHGVLVSDGMNRCAYPDPPRALCFRPSDWPDICADPLRHCEMRTFDNGENKRVYNDGTGLTRKARALWNSGVAVDGLGLTEDEHTRILEMKAAYKRWQIDVARAEEEAGMTDPVRMFEHESEIVEKLLQTIAATPARTLKGLAAKGRAMALAQSSPLEALEQQLASLLSEPDARERDITKMSFMVDAMRLPLGIPPAT